MFVPIPAGLRARDLVVDYTSTHIKFGIKGKPAFVDADLPKRVKTSECMWTLGGCQLEGSASCAAPQRPHCAVFDGSSVRLFGN